MSNNWMGELNGVLAAAMDTKLQAMTEDEFALYFKGATATLKACQKEFERRLALKLGSSQTWGRA